MPLQGLRDTNTQQQEDEEEAQNNYLPNLEGFQIQNTENLFLEEETNFWEEIGDLYGRFLWSLQWRE